MTKPIGALLIFVSLFLTTACGPLGDAALSPQEVAIRRAEIIERLAPEDGSISSRRLAAVVEATTTVMKDLDKRRFPRLGPAVREALRNASLRELRQIEAILPEIERKRQLEGVD